MELDKICQNCSNFFQDIKDLNAGFGVCINDEEFEPFLDEVIDCADFSCCYELYQEKRSDGGREPCDQYEEPEMLEISEGEDFNVHIFVEEMKHGNVDEIINYLYNSDNEIVKRAISTIDTCIRVGNESAYEGLINYYMGLKPAESLEDVYTRMKIIETLSTKESEQKTMEAYVNELARTPSNNTTRQLYSLILEHLSKCPEEMIWKPLFELLEKRQYSYKIKKRIKEIAGL